MSRIVDSRLAFRLWREPLSPGTATGTAPNAAPARLLSDTPNIAGKPLDKPHREPSYPPGYVSMGSDPFDTQYPIPRALSVDPAPAVSHAGPARLFGIVNAHAASCCRGCQGVAGRLARSGSRHDRGHLDGMGAGRLRESRPGQGRTRRRHPRPFPRDPMGRREGLGHRQSLAIGTFARSRRAGEGGHDARGILPARRLARPGKAPGPPRRETGQARGHLQRFPPHVAA